MGTLWSNTFEDFRPAQPEPVAVWNEDRKALTWLVPVHSEQYPLRRRIPMGTLVVKGSMLGDLLVSIQE